jgi:acetyltransferase-like isoleucine patch superfamily enzyme
LKSRVFVEYLTWAVASVFVLDRVRIGTRSIVGAGAVRTRDVLANSVATGVPTEVKKTSS